MSKTIRKNCPRLYGCEYDEAVAANGGPLTREQGSLAVAFLRHRAQAARRGVGFLLTFPEWAMVWRESGHLALRGRGAGKYCMARNGDVGPYAVGNVSIQLFETNSKHLRPPNSEKLSAAAKKRLGTGRGWTYRPSKSTARPYQVIAGSRYVGCFATQAEAEAAYAAAV